MATTPINRKVMTQDEMKNALKKTLPDIQAYLKEHYKRCEEAMFAEAFKLTRINKTNI